MSLQPHQERVVVETNEVKLKLTNLAKFINSDFFKTVDTDEQERLKRQIGFMRQYYDVLEERIAAFK